MGSYKSGSYVRQNSIKKRKVEITVQRLAETVAHESDNNIDPEEAEQDAWFERMFSEDGSSDTSGWSKPESSSIEEEEDEESSVHSLNELEPPSIPRKGKFARWVSVSKCKLRIKKHTPGQITEPMLFSRKQRQFPLDFLAWLTWKRYKNLTDYRLGCIQQMTNQYLRDSPQLNAFIDNFCTYEYERLCRPQVLSFMHSLRQ